MGDKVLMQLKQLSKRAMVFAEKTIDIIVKNSSDTVAIAGYVNAAYSLACAARSVYISNIEKLENKNIEEFFSSV